MEYLNHREGGLVFNLNCRNCKRLREFEEIEISRQAVEVTVNSKEENS